MEFGEWNIYYKEILDDFGFSREDDEKCAQLLDEILSEEGCLSLLGGPRKCKRYKAIKVQYQNEKFQLRYKTYTGWTAQIIQHEIDHCNGILI